MYRKYAMLPIIIFPHRYVHLLIRHRSPFSPSLSVCLFFSFLSFGHSHQTALQAPHPFLLHLPSFLPSPHPASTTILLFSSFQQLSIASTRHTFPPVFASSNSSVTHACLCSSIPFHFPSFVSSGLPFESAAFSIFSFFLSIHSLTPGLFFQ